MLSRLLSTLAFCCLLALARLRVFVGSLEVTPPNGISPISPLPFAPPDVPSLAAR
jgi:hypothetical protein